MHFKAWSDHNLPSPHLVSFHLISSQLAWSVTSFRLILIVLIGHSHLVQMK